jgi:hypothetical protein
MGKRQDSYKVLFRKFHENKVGYVQINHWETGNAKA